MRYVGAGHEESKVLWEFVQSTLREEVTGQIEISESDELELTELQAANYGDGILTKHYNNDIQAKEFIHYIAKHESDTKLTEITGSEFIAVALDGSTDSANIEEKSSFVS